MFDTKNLKNLYKEELIINKDINPINSDTLKTFLDKNIFKIEKLSGKFVEDIFLILEDNRIYATRHGSPLLVGQDNSHAYICSEQSGFCGLVNNYIILKNIAQQS